MASTALRPSPALPSPATPQPMKAGPSETEAEASPLQAAALLKIKQPTTLSEQTEALSIQATVEPQTSQTACSAATPPKPPEEQSEEPAALSPLPTAPSPAIQPRPPAGR